MWPVESSGGMDTESTSYINYNVLYLQVSALVLTLYDHFLNLDREFAFIWSQPKTSISFYLFAFTRYGGDILLIGSNVVFLNQKSSLAACVSIFFLNFSKLNRGTVMGTHQYSCTIGLKIIGIGSILCIILAQVSMQLRLKTLYGLRENICRLINGLWAMELISVAILGGFTTFSINVSVVEVNTAKMCTVVDLPKFAAAFWLPILLFEFFLFSLAFRLAWGNHQDLGNWRGAKLLHVVLRDNFYYFFLAFCSYLTTAIAWHTVGVEFFLVPGLFSCALTTIMGCRFILNLCEAYHDPFNFVMVTPDAPSRSSRVTSGGIRFVNFSELESRMSIVEA